MPVRTRPGTRKIYISSNGGRGFEYTRDCRRRHFVPGCSSYYYLTTSCSTEVLLRCELMPLGEAIYLIYDIVSLSAQFTQLHLRPSKVTG